MIILYIPRCILGMLDHFHGQETFCLVRGSLSCSETPYFHKVVNWRFFMEKNFFFGRGINELVRNALFSSRQPWRSGTRCARRRIRGEASTSIGQESGRRRRGGWRRSRRSFKFNTIDHWSIGIRSPDWGDEGGVPEVWGNALKHLAKPEPLKNKGCRRDDCFPCKTSGPGKCEKNGCGYKVRCETCKLVGKLSLMVKQDQTVT